MNKNLHLHEQNQIEILKILKNQQRFRVARILLVSILVIVFFELLQGIKMEFEAQKFKPNDVDYEKLLLESCQCHCQDLSE